MHGTIYEFEALPHFRRKGTGAAPLVESYVPQGPTAPLVGIVRNPRSHRNKGRPAELADCPNILTETPKSREALRESLLEFAERGVDYLVIDGGDGTVRDVLTCGAEIFGEAWPALIVLPKGKTNALAVDLGLPNHWSLAEALVAARAGGTVQRRPMRIAPAGQEGCALGFFLGAGAFTLGTEIGQEAHRRGAYNSFAVGLIVAWSVIQALLGRAGNPWRAGTRMRFRERATGRELPRTGPGAADERFLVAISTFQKLPLGIRLFGRNPPPGIKLTLVDAPVRWLLMLAPVILLGWLPRFVQRAGMRYATAQALDFELGGAFVLDGEVFPAGHYLLEEGPQLTFVVP